MNQDCEKYAALMEDVFNRAELDEQITRKLEKHIFHCFECRREYELLRREKEILGHYLFNFEPPPDSWINFQARLCKDQATTSQAAIAPVSSRPEPKSLSLALFSRGLAAATVLLLVGGIGLVRLMKTGFERNSDQESSRTRSENSPLPAEFGGSNTHFEAMPAAGNPLPNNGLAAKKSVATKNITRSDKVTMSAKTLKTKTEIVLPGLHRKPVNGYIPKFETRPPERQRQNIETEIAVQIEKIELLLRSFRNAQSTTSQAGFDLDYEKQQARKLLRTNAKLRRAAEIYGIPDANELLGGVETYLLEIANLGLNPKPEKVLDLKERVSSQNIIASLQVYGSPEGQY